MANTDNNTIQLHISKSSPLVEGYFENAIPTCLPGRLMKRIGEKEFRMFDLVEEPAQKLFAIENIYTGGDIDDPYNPGDYIFIRNARAGDIVLAWLDAEEAVIIGDDLSSSAEGTLQKWTGTGQPGSVIGVALEAITTGIGEFSRIRVLIK